MLTPLIILENIFREAIIEQFGLNCETVLVRFSNTSEYGFDSIIEVTTRDQIDSIDFSKVCYIIDDFCKDTYGFTSPAYIAGFRHWGIYRLGYIGIGIPHNILKQYINYLKLKNICI